MCLKSNGYMPILNSGKQILGSKVGKKVGNPLDSVL